MADAFTTRFAPSPTGYLHLGHVRAAMFAQERARASGGRFLLRIEDIDRSRCRPEYTAAILDDLGWLGFVWDGKVRVQSEHLADYSRVLDALNERGLIYPCFCTRAAIQREAAQSSSAPHAPEGPLYPGTCRHLTGPERAARIEGGQSYALRLDLTRALRQVSGPLAYEEEGTGTITCRPERFGDIVLARKDIRASYHLCVTHDDALQGVTLVTRGVDLQPAADLHRLLQVLMGWPAPRYSHHPLLTDAAGRRLAKRNDAATVRSLRERGVPAARVREMSTIRRHD